jgi:hypothetical protein
MKKILILEANPRRDLSLNDEIRDLENVINQAGSREQIEVKIGLSVRPTDLQALMLKIEPNIVHFCGHGTGEQGLVFVNELKHEQLVGTSALSDLFESFAHYGLECVVLNACYSEEQANSIVQHISYVVGMSQAIRDDAAISFATGFYRALAHGRSIEEAYKLGCNAIHLTIPGSSVTRSSDSIQERKLGSVGVSESSAVPEHLKPVLKKREASNSNSRSSAESSLDNLYALEQAGQLRTKQIQQRVDQIEKKLQPDLSLQLKEALKWLADRKNLAHSASEFVFKKNSAMRSRSMADREQFCWEVESYLEAVYYSILSETLDLMDEPPIPPSFEADTYRSAFGFVKSRIPVRLDKEIREQLETYLDYLFKRLPF